MLFELVVNKRSSLEGRTLREVDFLYCFEGCVISVKRKELSICLYSFENFRLEMGDVLLVEAPASKDAEYRAHSDFSLCSVVPGSKPPRFNQRRDLARQVMAGLLYLTAVVLSASKVMDIGVSAFFVGIILIMNKTLTIEEAMSASKANIYLMIAGSLGMSKALLNSGAMYKGGVMLVELSSRWGGWWVIVVIYLIVHLLSVFI